MSQEVSVSESCSCLRVSRYFY